MKLKVSFIALMLAIFALQSENFDIPVLQGYRLLQNATDTIEVQTLSIPHLPSITLHINDLEKEDNGADYRVIAGSLSIDDDMANISFVFNGSKKQLQSLLFSSLALSDNSQEMVASLLQGIKNNGQVVAFREKIEQDSQEIESPSGELYELKSGLRWDRLTGTGSFVRFPPTSEMYIVWQKSLTEEGKPIRYNGTFIVSTVKGFVKTKKDKFKGVAFTFKGDVDQLISIVKEMTVLSGNDALNAFKEKIKKNGTSKTIEVTKSLIDKIVETFYE